MTDRDDNEGAVTRRGFLRGDFLAGGRDAEASEEAEAGDGDERGPEETDQPPPETRGPAADLEAILERAEEIAGVSGRDEETPHPFYQHADSGEPE